MHKLIYASKATVKMGFHDVKDIAEKASANNTEKNITGLLVFGGGYFMQLIEGDAADINQLYLKVAADKRHKNICLLGYEDILFRQFKDWNMGCLMLDNQPEIESIVKAVFEDGKFNPYELSPKYATQFLTELAIYFQKS